MEELESKVVEEFKLVEIIVSVESEVFGEVEIKEMVVSELELEFVKE